MTFGTTVASMTQSGYIPNFIDVDKQTLCIDEKLIKKKINKNTVGLYTKFDWKLTKLAINQKNCKRI